jgi:hypothetical protein
MVITMCKLLKIVSKSRILYIYSASIITISVRISSKVQREHQSLKRKTRSVSIITHPIEDNYKIDFKTKRSITDCIHPYLHLDGASILLYRGYIKRSTTQRFSLSKYHTRYNVTYFVLLQCIICYDLHIFSIQTIMR